MDADERSRVLDLLVRWSRILQRLGTIAKTPHLIMPKITQGVLPDEISGRLVALVTEVNELMEQAWDIKSWAITGTDSVELAGETVMLLNEVFVCQVKYLHLWLRYVEPYRDKQSPSFERLTAFPAPSEGEMLSAARSLERAGLRATKAMSKFAKHYHISKQDWEQGLKSDE